MTRGKQIRSDISNAGSEQRQILFAYRLQSVSGVVTSEEYRQRFAALSSISLAARMIRSVEIVRLYKIPSRNTGKSRRVNIYRAFSRSRA